MGEGFAPKSLWEGRFEWATRSRPPMPPRHAPLLRSSAQTNTEWTAYSRSVNHSAVSGASLIAGPQSRAPNADAPDRDRAGGVRALEGAAAGRGVRARPRRMRWPLVHPDRSEGGVGPGQDFSDPEVDTEPDRSEAPGLVPREPRAARACPPPSDAARMPLRLHDQRGREGESHADPGHRRPEGPRRDPEADARSDRSGHAGARPARVQRPR